MTVIERLCKFYICTKSEKILWLSQHCLGLYILSLICLGYFYLQCWGLGVTNWYNSFPISCRQSLLWCKNSKNPIWWKLWHYGVSFNIIGKHVTTLELSRNKSMLILSLFMFPLYNYKVVYCLHCKLIMLELLHVQVHLKHFTREF